MNRHRTPAVHVGLPNVGDRVSLQQRFDRILSDRWLTNDGPFVREFEVEFARYCGVRNCVAVTNGTTGLELAIRALDLQGEVILPSFTFIATAHALHWHGITPVFCDVDPVSLCIDPKRIGELITPQTSAIIGVHVYGRACDVTALREIASRHRLALLFDAAHAVGSTAGGQRVGGFGACEVFSFHATKVLNTLEGGAITTNDDELAARLRRLRNFGFPGDGRDVTVELGINAKMNEFCAAVGLTNLASLDEFIAANERNYTAYRDGLTGIPGIALLPYDAREKHNFQYVIVRVDERAYGHARDRLQSALSDRGVLARRYFSPGCHASEPYRSTFPEAGARLPVTVAVAREVLALPTGPQLEPWEIGEICRFIRQFQTEG